LLEVSNKPLTLIYPGAKNLAGNLLAENGSIAIRIVKDEFCRELITKFRKPIVSTSANLSGQKAPVCFDEIPEIMRMGVDYIVNWRQDDISPRQPSAIIELALNGQFKIIRK